MNDCSFFDDTFDPNRTTEYHLSIQLKKSGYIYCILDTIWNRYIAAGCTNLELNSTNRNSYFDFFLFKQTPLLRSTYRSIAFVYTTPKATLIPKSFFNPSKSAEYLRFNHFVDHSDEIQHKRLTKTGAYVVFSIPVALHESIQSTWSDVVVYHHSISLIENALLPPVRLTDEFDRRRLLLNCNDSFIEIAVVEQSKLLFYNTFKYRSDKDLVYFVMLVYKQLKLNPAIHYLIISGDIEKTSPVYRVLYQYIRNIEFARFDTGFEYSTLFDTIPQQYFSNLINLYRCVS